MRLSAAVRDAREPVVVAGYSAAVLWGIPLEGEPLEEVTFLRSDSPTGGRSEPGVRRTVVLGGGAVPHRRDGFDVIDLPRAVLASALAASPPQALAILDWALSERNPEETDRAALEVALGEVPVRRRPALRRLLATADPRIESVGESWSRWVLRRMGFADPEPQVELERDIRVDFRWREAGVVLEFDGRVKYRLDSADGASAERLEAVLWSEKRREDRIRRLGYTVVRVTWADLHRPAALERLLDEAGVPRS